MADICFVTYELAPVNRGGAGVVIAALAEHLAAAGHRIHIIADMSASEIAAYRSHLQREKVEGVTVHPLAELSHPHPPADTIFQAKSCAFRNAVYRLAREVRLDAVEFFEYAGSAFDTVTLREEGDALDGVAVVVRIHGSLGVIDHASGMELATAERHAMYRQEQWAMALADVVLAPLAGIGEQYAFLYGIPRERLRTSPPPMERLLSGLGGPLPRQRDANEVLLWGKLHPIKGSDLFVEAALALSELRPDLRYVLVGADTRESPSGGSMREHLEWLTPRSRRHLFTYVDHLPRRELAARAARSLCAVVPSRAESLCLVAHELARVGCPLVLNDIPPFREFEEGKECIHFDDTPAGLAFAVERLARDPGLRERLAEVGPTRRYPSPLSGYAGLCPAPALADSPAAFARWEVRSLAAKAASESASPPSSVHAPSRIFRRLVAGLRPRAAERS